MEYNIYHTKGSLGGAGRDSNNEDPAPKRITANSTADAGKKFYSNMEVSVYGQKITRIVEVKR